MEKIGNGNDDDDQEANTTRPFQPFNPLSQWRAIRNANNTARAERSAFL